MNRSALNAHDTVPSLSPLARPGLRFGFTLVELLVVVGVLAILMGLLLPAIMRVASSGRDAAINSQIQAISAACETYYNDFNAYPGYLNHSTDTGLWTDLTGTENLVLSLMGGVQQAGSADDPITISGLSITIDAEDIGTGPTTAGQRGRSYGAYYSPKQSELRAVQGEYNQNSMPELVDVSYGMPVLYARAAAGQSQPASKMAVDDGIFACSDNGKYLGSTGLIAPDGTSVPVTFNSLLWANVSATENGQNLAWMVIHPAMSDESSPNAASNPVKGGYLLHAAGQDMIYLAEEQNPNSNSSLIGSFDNLDDFDDIYTVGGTAP